jgi:N-acetylneuraminic acid mutarotase
MVSFGGYTGPAHRGDLRVLAGNAWQTIGRHPEMAVAEPGFVYDSRRDRFVTFGGSAGPGQLLGTTWEYDGATWTKVSVPSPPARMAHAMVFDERRGRTVVFGGMGVGAPGQPPPSLGDTWEFDGQTWTRLEVAGPSPRSGAGAAYDHRRALVLLFGGVTADGFQGDTWSWDGTEWKKLAETGPEPRGMGYLAYDKARDRVVLFGGRKGWPDGDLNDTWEWDGAVWRRIGG